jgi:hypothetical protein
VVRNLPLPYTEFTALRAVGLGSTNANSVALIGVNAVGTMATSGKVWEFSGIGQLRNAHQRRALDGCHCRGFEQRRAQRPGVLETAKNYLDVVAFEKPHKLVPANRWQVFEERTFRSRRNDATEPREAVIADVTGDGKADLIVLVHDRILVYPQE